MRRRWLRWRLRRAEQALAEWVAIRDAMVRFEDQVSREHGLQRAWRCRTRDVLRVEETIRDVANLCSRLRRRLRGAV